MHLNMALEPPKVTIAALDYHPGEGVLEVLATATTPSGAGPDRIEIFLNEHRETVLTESPYRAWIATEELRPADVVRVLAHYPNGETAEAAKLPAVAGPSDELEVNLVELLAMVTPRNRKADVELQSSDFIIRQQGQFAARRPVLLTGRRCN